MVYGTFQLELQLNLLNSDPHNLRAGSNVSISYVSWDVLVCLVLSLCTWYSTIVTGNSIMQSPLLIPKGF